MTSDEAGRLGQGAKKQEACSHRRLLDTERTAEGQETGRFICKECGAVVLTKGGDQSVNQTPS